MAEAVKRRIWTGAAGTDEWNQVENWTDGIIPNNGENVTIAMIDSGTAPAPNAPANLNIADLYVEGNIGGGPILVNGAFHWKSGRIAADLDLKNDGSVTTGRVELSGTIKGSASLTFEGDDQLLLDGGTIVCNDNVTFTNCGLRAVSDAPSRFTSKNFYIQDTSRFSGKSLAVERAAGGLLRVDGELDVDEGAKLIVNLGLLEGTGFLNIIYDATMDLEQGIPTSAGRNWLIVTPWHTTARFGFKFPGSLKL